MLTRETTLRVLPSVAPSCDSVGIGPDVRLRRHFRHTRVPSVAGLMATPKCSSMFSEGVNMGSVDPDSDRRRLGGFGYGVRIGRGTLVVLLVALVFTAAGLLDGFLWPFPSQARHSLALASVLALGFGAVATALLCHLRPRLPGVAVALVGYGLVLAGAQSGTRVIGLATFVLGLELACPRDSHWDSRDARRRLLAISAAVAVFGLFSALRMQSWLRLSMDQFAGMTSSMVGTLTGNDLHLGSTALGLDGAFLSLLLIMASVAGAPGPRATRLLAGVGVVSVIVVTHAWVFAVRTATLRSFTLEGFEEGPIWFETLWWQWLALIIAVASMLTIGRSSIAKSTLTRSTASLLGAATTCAVFLALWYPGQQQPSAGRILMASIREDVASGGNGYYENETFTLFARTLAAVGYDVERTSEPVDSASLENVDAVILFTPFLPGPSNVAVLDSFVRQGGGVLIVGDHTPGPESLKGLNSFLEPLGIHYNFDSAFLHGMPLDTCARVAGSELGRAFRSCPEDNYGVGASLELGWDAQAVLEARWAVGDRGHSSTPSLLGNRHYEHGDHLGDRVVVASADVGKGRLVVVADTGAFSDSAIPFSYPFALAAARSVIAGRQGPSGFLHGVCGLASFFLALGWMLLGPRVGLLCIAMGAAPAELASAPEPFVFKSGKHFAIDFSHHPLTASLDRNVETSVKGFANQCFRTGHVPVVTMNLAATLGESPAGVALIAPVVPYSAELVSAVLGYVTAGGTLWVVAGHEEAGPIAPLLDAFGVRVSSMVLGSLRHRVKRKRAGSSEYATDIRYEEAWALELDPATSHTTLLEVDGQPVVAEIRKGLGRVFVVADSYFLSDRNLETGTWGVPGNVVFVRNCLRPQ